jgi:[lysine-biosynthesis-protein LysW]--L-2-aminoadipate ligase
VTAAIGVLCARVRLEEKQLLAALAEAGVPAMPLAPAASPFPIAPAPVPPGPVGHDGSTGHRVPAGRDSMRDGADGIDGVEVVIDRLADRTLASALLPLWQAQGKVVLDAGLAATGNRAAVAAALAAAGLPRPLTLLASSEESALAAIERTGLPATLLPLTGGASITLWDRDSAEAIIEHRTVLGDPADAIVLVQAGAPAATERALVHVVGGEAVAVDDAGALIPATPAVVALAEAAARALGAAVVGVEIALTPAGCVVWDVQPVADFRNACDLGGRTAAAAITALAAARLAARPAFERAVRVQVQSGAEVDRWPVAERGVEHDAVLTA